MPASCTSLAHTLLIPDFQAHGESPGRFITFGALESLDAAAALQFLRVHSGGERIGVIGVSMGGAAALVGPGPLTADALVLESVYPTFHAAVYHRARHWSGPLGFLAPALTSIALASITARTGVSADALQPIDRIGRLQMPVLVAGGDADPSTPPSETRALFARTPMPKTLWIVPHAGH